MFGKISWARISLWFMQEVENGRAIIDIKKHWIEITFMLCIGGIKHKK